MRYLPLCEIDIGQAETLAVNGVMKSGWISEGPFVFEFERKCALMHNKRFAIMLPSGTVAIALALLSLRDDMFLPKERRSSSFQYACLCPAYGFIATVNACMLANYNVQLVDIDYDTLCMDPNKIPCTENAVLVPVHFNGLPFQIPSDNILPVVEDGACAVGVEGIGSGDALCLSFGPTKLVTTGHGGMVLTDVPEIANRVRAFRDHGRAYHDATNHQTLGWMFRCTDIQGAIGCTQLNRYDELREGRLSVIRWYKAFGVPVMRSPTPWYAMVKVENPKECVSFCRGKGIDVRRLYKAVYNNSGYAYLGSSRMFPNAERAEKTVITLPISSKMNHEEAEFVADTLKRVAQYVDKS